jgi:hypothetical protein
VTAEQIFGCVAIAAMLALVLSRVASDRAPRNFKWRMALIWAAIIALITMIAWIAPNGGLTG